MSLELLICLVAVAGFSFLFGLIVGVEAEKSNREMRKLDKDLKRLKERP